jgi:hypothetical protein
MEKKSYIEKEGVKAMPWSTFFTRTADIPLDRSSMFGSYDDALKYAKGDEADPDERKLVSASYIGQTITVYENDEVKLYQINEERDLERVDKGAIIVTDENSANKIANKEKYIGHFIWRLDNKKLYFIVQQDNLIEIMSFENGEPIIDCGEY